MGGVDFELGLVRCAGKGELYERILRRFADTRNGTPGDIQRQLEGGELAGAEAMAHGLISTAATVGATALSDAARALEQAIKRGDRAAWGGLMAELQRETGRVWAEVRDYLDPTPGAAGDKNR